MAAAVLKSIGAFRHGAVWHRSVAHIRNVALPGFANDT